jgi:hypothetical protein
MHIQAAGADSLAGVSSIGQINSQQNATAVAANFIKAGGPNSSLPKEIYDTL